MGKVYTDESFEEPLREIAKEFKGTFIKHADDSFEVRGLLDATIEHALKEKGLIKE